MSNAPTLLREQEVFATPWFSLMARTWAENSPPHYCIRTKDYVSVVAITKDRKLILVRQFRSAVGRETMELPAGHVEPGQTPEEAARLELSEETGHRAERFTLLGELIPDTGRMSNRMWCFFAEDAEPIKDHEPEAGIQVVLHDGPIGRVLTDGMEHALNLAAILLATLSGRLAVDLSRTTTREPA
jgi:8-oxo-dGTP pyrophosphatase MutT (NUDIX family)